MSSKLPWESDTNDDDDFSVWVFFWILVIIANILRRCGVV